MIKRLLVGLGDDRFARSATEHAIQMAKQHDAQLTAVTLFDPHSLDVGPIPIGAGASARDLREHRLGQTVEVLEQAVRYFEQRCQSENLRHDVLHETGNPFERLIAASRYYDQMVCGLKNLFAHGVVEEPPYELIRLVESGVRPLIAVGDCYREIQRILIAYSGSIESAKTMKRFVQQRNWPDAALKIVTFDDDRTAGEDRLARAREYCNAHGLSAETEVVAQAPKEALLPYAEGWGADLIVLGNSAKRLLLRRIFGETALHVVANAERPLFLSQ